MSKSRKQPEKNSHQHHAKNILRCFASVECKLIQNYIYICIRDIVNNVMSVSCANKQLKWSVAPCKGIRIPESGKCFVESGILGFGIRNPGFTDKESGIQHLETGIKNPRMSCIGFPKIVLHSSYKGRDQSDLPELINTNRDTFRSVGFLLS